MELASLPSYTKEDPFIKQLFKGVTKLASVRLWQSLAGFLEEEKKKRLEAQAQTNNSFVSLIPSVPHISAIPQDSEASFTEWLQKAGVSDEGVQILTGFYDVSTARVLQQVVEERGGMVALRKLERLYEIDFLILQLGVQRVVEYPVLEGSERAMLPGFDEGEVLLKGVGECKAFRDLGMNEDLLLDLREKNILLPVLFNLLNLTPRTCIVLQTALSFSPRREKTRERRKCGTLRGRIQEGFGDEEVKRWMLEVGALEVVEVLWESRESLCINNGLFFVLFPNLFPNFNGFLSLFSPIGEVLKEMAEGRDRLEDWATLFSEIPLNQVFLFRSALMEDFCQ